MPFLIELASMAKAAGDIRLNLFLTILKTFVTSSSLVTKEIRVSIFSIAKGCIASPILNLNLGTPANTAYLILQGMSIPLTRTP